MFHLIFSIVYLVEMEEQILRFFESSGVELDCVVVSSMSEVTSIGMTASLTV